MAICIEMLKISTSAFFHVQIMVSNAIPLLFGNYDAHIMYIYIYLKSTEKCKLYIKREFTDAHTKTFSLPPPLSIITL